MQPFFRDCSKSWRRTCLHMMRPPIRRCGKWRQASAGGNAFPRGALKNGDLTRWTFTMQSLRAAKRLDLWATDYLQIMPDLDGIVDWYTSTGLRPYLNRIEDDAERRT